MCLWYLNLLSNQAKVTSEHHWPGLAEDWKATDSAKSSQGCTDSDLACFGRSFGSHWCWLAKPRGHRSILGLDWQTMQQPLSLDSTKESYVMNYIDHKSCTANLLWKHTWGYCFHSIFVKDMHDIIDRNYESLLPRNEKYGTLHEFACHPCAGAMLIFSVSFQF